MEFKDLFSVLKKRMSDGDDVPYFFREIISMITDVTEEEWGTPKDPATKRTKTETLKNYVKRGLSKKFAQSIVYRLTPDILIERIEERPETVRTLLADDLKPYDPSLNADTVAEAIADWMVDIIRRAAGLVPQDELTRLKQQELAFDLKKKYGEYLVNETEGHCPFPGCGRSLAVSDAGKVAYSYEVGLIDKEKAPELNNLLALCPQCYSTYLIDDNKKLCKELQNVKKILVTHKQSAHLIDALPLEKGIVSVIKHIKNLKESDLLDASLDPKELTQKIKPQENMALYLSVKSYVTMYYIRIKEIMTNLDKRGEIDYDEIQDQIHAIYKRLKKSKKTELEIFNEISKKIHSISLQEDIFCQIVVSYFIQKCEVFDAITE